MSDLLPVTELKQWAYCPRVVYYHQVMPGAGVTTFKMREAVRAQELIESLEMRRGLREYSLEGAERHFGVWLTDADLGLSGKLDLLLRAPDRATVVDFKLTSGEVGENHRMQLAGYAMLVEAAVRLPVELAFVYRIPDNAILPIPITAELRRRVVEALVGIRRIREIELCPEATDVRGRCVECEYANFCADVW